MVLREGPCREDLHCHLAMHWIELHPEALLIRQTAPTARQASHSGGNLGLRAKRAGACR